LHIVLLTLVELLLLLAGWLIWPLPPARDDASIMLFQVNTPIWSSNTRALCCPTLQAGDAEGRKRGW